MRPEHGISPFSNNEKSPTAVFGTRGHAPGFIPAFINRSDRRSVFGPSTNVPVLPQAGTSKFASGHGRPVVAGKILHGSVRPENRISAFSSERSPTAVCCTREDAPGFLKGGIPPFFIGLV